MIVEIQCLPKPSGSAQDPYAVVKAAIAQVEESGLRYEVGALGTTIEGEPDELWPLLRRVHEACLAAGATSVVSNVKVAEWSDVGAAAVPSDSSPTMDSLVDGYRR